MLWSDSRALWDGRIMPDPRVTHFWDAERTIGQWFAGQVDGYEGVSWDAYYLYGPGAVWDTIPAPLLGSGRTIYAERQALEAQVKAILGE